MVNKKTEKCSIVMVTWIAQLNTTKLTQYEIVT